MKHFLLLLFLLSPLIIKAQPSLSIYENNSFISFEKQVYSDTSDFHSSIRPFMNNDLKKALSYDSLMNEHRIARFSEKKVADLIFNKNLFSVHNEKFGITLDPLFDFSAGYDLRDDRSLWINTRGFLLQGHLGDKFAFSSSFYETQARQPLWIYKYAFTRITMPGQGRIKGLSNEGLDYANASGYISWSPSEFFNFQFGHGKQFLGDGYRSMILSDFSLYHPYLMVTTSFWKIKYINLFSQFSHPDEKWETAGDPVYKKKYSTMHYLSFAPGKRFNISIFESIIWKMADSTFQRGFDINYLNPVIFYRPIEFNLGSGDNITMGLNLRYSISDGITVYGQFVFDEMRIKELTSGNGWVGNKFAWQTGVKGFDLFRIKNLYIQVEYNYIRPYMYTHITPVQSYSHAREPLAHPNGANTKEAVAIVRYNHKRLFFNMKYIWSGSGLDSTGINYGKNIFKAFSPYPFEYGNRTGQGLYTSLNQLDASVSYLVNPSTNMNIFISATIRKEENYKMKNNYCLINFGFRTSLRNLYYDFLP
jgi:hypothetical protein